MGIFFFLLTTLNFFSFDYIDFNVCCRILSRLCQHSLIDDKMAKGKPSVMEMGRLRAGLQHAEVTLQLSYVEVFVLIQVHSMINGGFCET